MKHNLLYLLLLQSSSLKCTYMMPGDSGPSRALLYLDEFCDIAWHAADSPMWRVAGSFTQRPLLEALNLASSSGWREGQHSSTPIGPLNRSPNSLSGTCRPQALFSTMATSLVSGEKLLHPLAEMQLPVLVMAHNCQLRRHSRLNVQSCKLQTLMQRAIEG